MPRHALGRYEDRGLLGEGGTAQVRRVWDAQLSRTLAMKILRSELLSHPNAVEWFEAEAHTIARLQHPGIVPIHEIGRLDDGRPYYTMKEVGGRTLREVVAELHAASRDGAWGTPASGWTLRRLLEACHRAAETVAYAHACGVYHRDLKPSNVMLGAFGEVLVLDWGLAVSTTRGAGERELPDWAIASGVRGTLAYMPPEQARGEVGRAWPRADVYSLGATLYEVLAGQPPYRGASSWAILTQLNVRPPEPIATVLSRAGGPVAPPEVVQLVERAMAREPAERFADAGELAAGLAAWLDGARRRDQALALVEQADAFAPRAAALRERARALLQEAAEKKKDILPTRPIEDKRGVWALEDEAARLDQEARRLEAERLQDLRAALAQSPDLVEAHDRLADHYQARMAQAEAARDRNAALEFETSLRAHDRGRHAAFLRGDGALTLLTDPPAEAELYRYVERDRRLVPEHVRSLGVTPLREVPLPMGSWLVVLRAPGRPEVRYPVSIRRQEHWDGVPPGATEPLPVPLPTAEDLGPDDVYVPCGWFWSGGDPDAASSLPRRRLWADGLVVRRFPVTNAEWVAFLDALVAQGREVEAVLHVPRERGNSQTALGAAIFGRDAEGRFVLGKDLDGDEWLPDAPVVMADWTNAHAFATHEAARTGRPWRLLGELEYEKATRGVDGRFLPWGDFLDPTWCCMADSHTGHRTPAVMSRFPVDESPYGIRHMAGNARTWCGDRWRPDGPPTPDNRVLPPEVSGDSADASFPTRPWRGGSWLDFARAIRAAGRSNGPFTDRYSRLGVRIARSWK